MFCNVTLLIQFSEISPSLWCFQSESSAVRVRLLWDTLTPDTDLWPPLYILWRIHSKTHSSHHGCLIRTGYSVVVSYESCSLAHEDKRA